jgi:hypothetical protein
MHFQSHQKAVSSFQSTLIMSEIPQGERNRRDQVETCSLTTSQEDRKPWHRLFRSADKKDADANPRTWQGVTALSSKKTLRLTFCNC